MMPHLWLHAINVSHADHDCAMSRVWTELENCRCGFWLPLSNRVYSTGCRHKPNLLKRQKALPTFSALAQTKTSGLGWLYDTGYNVHAEWTVLYALPTRDKQTLIVEHLLFSRLFTPGSKTELFSVLWWTQSVQEQ